MLPAPLSPLSPLIFQTSIQQRPFSLRVFVDSCQTASKSKEGDLQTWPIAELEWDYHE